MWLEKGATLAAPMLRADIDQESLQCTVRAYELEAGTGALAATSD